MAVASDRAHSYTSCPLRSDPGPVDNAPFAEALPSDPRAFGSMCSGEAASTSACPPVGLTTGSNFGCVPFPGAGGEEGGEACWPESQGMRCFFGVPPNAPAIWTTRPDLSPVPAERRG